MRNKRNLKIIGLYLISMFCIISYLLLESSDSITEFNQKADNFRTDTGFFVFITTGLFKYGLLLIGTSVFTVLTFLLFKEKSTTNE